MSLDSELVPVLELLAANPLPDLDEVAPEALRGLMSGVPVEQPTEVGSVTDMRTPAGIDVRVYCPPGATNAPLVMFFHGGGFVVCNLDTHDELCRRLCAGAAAVVVSVDYRLAPEAPFPAAPQDCYSATCWAADNAAQWGADPSRLLVAGDSAGGNLAAAVTLLARDNGAPVIERQLLLYPVTDCNFDTPSYLENAEGYYLTRAMMQWFWGHYLARPEDAADPLASPLRGELGGLPAASILTAGFDPLRDEGLAYAEALACAGVSVNARSFPGMIHGFVTMPGLTQANAAIEWLTTEISQPG